MPGGNTADWKWSTQRPGKEVDRPTNEQRARVKPAGIEADHDGWDRLAAPNSAQELQLNGLFDRREDGEDERAKLDHQ
jgi:hypothetical protein